MKLVSFLTRVTGVTGAAFLFGLAFDQYALALFALATSACVLLVAAVDYMQAAVAIKPDPVGRTRSGRNRPRYSLPFAA